MMDQRNVPTEAFLYKQPSSIVKQAAKNVFAAYNVSSSFEGSQEYFTFPGDSLGLVLLSRTDIKFWIEDLGDDKSVLYLSAFASRTGRYTPNLRHAVVRQRIRKYLTAIEEETVDVARQLFLSEQYLRVFRLTGELEVLYSDLQQLEEHSSNTSTQAYQLRSAIRIKRSELDQETYILSRLKDAPGM